VSDDEAKPEALAQLTGRLERSAPSSLSVTPQTTVPRISFILLFTSPPSVAPRERARHPAATRFGHRLPTTTRDVQRQLVSRLLYRRRIS
jgi:hypothetical protein